MNETILSIAKWHEETFPDATLEGQELKYRDELMEWTDSGCKDVTELADMLIVACGIARFDIKEGMFYIADVMDWASECCMPSLMDAVQEKMKINRQRKWTIGKGNYQHIPEGE